MISITKSNGEIRIYVNTEGIIALKRYLSDLEDNKDTHFHLMTSAWGGYELSGNTFVADEETVNQVLIQRVPVET